MSFLLFLLFLFGVLFVCFVVYLCFFIQVIRQGVYSDMNVIPVLPLKKFNRVGELLHLNSYALDFFKHGSEKAITKENG